MGKLSDLLKTKRTKIEVSDIRLDKDKMYRKAEPMIIQTKDVKSLEDENDGQVDLLFNLTEEELEEIRNSVVEIDTNGKSRREIIIGMFGGIKNPRTGKRFVIPGLDYTSKDYVYEYANYMKMLIYRPEDFKKIMNWE